MRYEKWYADIVDAAGQGVFLQALTVHGRGVTLHATSAQRFNEHGGDRTDTRLQRATIERFDEQIRISDCSTVRSGTWEPIGPPSTHMLYSNDQAFIEWTCHAPRARAHVVMHDGSTITGLGYVECLRSNIAPWNMPLSVLRWGRTITDATSDVWIEWDGAHPLQLYLHNGVVTSTPTNHVRDAQCTSLRSGHVRTSVLGPLGVIARLFRLRRFDFLEAKFLCSMMVDGRAGWSINEEVQWQR